MHARTPFFFAPLTLSAHNFVNFEFFRLIFYVIFYVILCKNISCFVCTELQKPPEIHASRLEYRLNIYASLI